MSQTGLRRLCFNSRTREGCDIVLRDFCGILVQFQFTHPRGVRLNPSCEPFNPRRFQFTHPRGVRPVCHLAAADRAAVSIHAPARGATSTATDQARARASFNSRTREGCDCSRPPHAVPAIRFNSRTREGCDLRGRKRDILFVNVSIHAPARGATLSVIAVV